MFINNNFAR